MNWASARGSTNERAVCVVEVIARHRRRSARSFPRPHGMSASSGWDDDIFGSSGDRWWHGSHRHRRRSWRTRGAMTRVDRKQRRERSPARLSGVPRAAAEKREMRHEAWLSALRASAVFVVLALLYTFAPLGQQL